MRALPFLLALLAVPTTAHAFAAKETSRGALVHFRDRHVVLIADQTKKAERDALRSWLMRRSMSMDGSLC